MDNRKKDSGTEVEKYKKSFFHSLDGIKYAIKNEHNMIIIIIAIISVTICGFLLNINSSEWLFIITMFGTISATELINSAVEANVDLCTTKVHPLAKIAKDTASGATLVLCITSIVGGLIIFLPKIIELLK